MNHPKSHKGLTSARAAAQNQLRRAVVETLESRRLLSAGQLDPTFANGGILTDNTLNAAQAVAIQSDGRVLVASSLPGSDGLDFSLARFNTDGTPDQTFGYHGRLVTDFGGIDMAASIAVQSDGKIVVAGATVPANTDGQNLVLARYNANGTLDTTFGTGGKELVPGTTHNDAEEKVLITATGKIVLGAYDFNQNTLEFFQFNSNGSLDPTFGSGGTVLTPVNPSISTVSLSNFALAPDGSIIAVGDLFPADNPEQGFVERITSTGVVDPTIFTLPTGPGGSAFTRVSADSVAVQSNGQIVVSGFDNNSNTGSIYVTRFNQNGTVDSSFGSSGAIIQPATSTKSTTVLIESDGKIDLTGIGQLTSGSSSSPVFFAERFTSTGQLDSTFGTNGETLVNLHQAVDTSSAALSPSGNIVQAGGNSQGSVLDIVRYTTDATVTPPATHVPNAPYHLVATPVSSTEIDLTWSQNNNGPAIDGYRVLDGKGNVLATLPNTASSYPATGLVGGMQYTFELLAFNNVGPSSMAGPVTATTLANGSDGNPGGVPNAPFNLEGLPANHGGVALSFIDNSNTETGFIVERATSPTGTFAQVATLPASPGKDRIVTYTDGSMLASGVSYSYKVLAVNGNIPSSSTGPVNVTTSPVVITQSNGKVLASEIDSSTVTAQAVTITRYNSDGTLDTSFGTGGTARIPSDNGDLNQITQLALLPSGSIVALIQGGISSNNPYTETRLTLLSTSGQLLNQSVPASGTANSPHDSLANLLAVGSNSEIFVVGNFITGIHDPTNPPAPLVVDAFNSNLTPVSTFGTNGRVQVDPTATGTTTPFPTALTAHSDGSVTVTYTNASNNSFTLTLSNLGVVEA